MNRHLLVLLALCAGATTQSAHADEAIQKLALRPAEVAASGAAAERVAAVHATTQAVVPDAVPVPPPAVDWSYTPRRSFQARRR